MSVPNVCTSCHCRKGRHALFAGTARETSRKGITMSVDKVGKGQREELSERELEAVSGGEEFS